MKVHSLDRLITELRSARVKVETIEEDARVLDKYYIAARYPGEYGGPDGLYTEIDAQAAVAAAQRIFATVQHALEKD